MMAFDIFTIRRLLLWTLHVWNPLSAACRQIGQSAAGRWRWCPDYLPTQKMWLPGGDICIVCSALIHKEWLIIQMARRRIIKPRQRWTNQPTHSPQFQLSVPPGGGVCTSDINDMTPCLVADYIISLHTSHCLQHFSTADTAGALLQTSLDPARDTRGHLAYGPPI